MSPSISKSSDDWILSPSSLLNILIKLVATHVLNDLISAVRRTWSRASGLNRSKNDDSTITLSPILSFVFFGLTFSGRLAGDLVAVVRSDFALAFGFSVLSCFFGSGSLALFGPESSLPNLVSIEPILSYSLAISANLSMFDELMIENNFLLPFLPVKASVKALTISSVVLSAFGVWSWSFVALSTYFRHPDDSSLTLSMAISHALSISSILFGHFLVMASYALTHQPDLVLFSRFSGSDCALSISDCAFGIVDRLLLCFDSMALPVRIAPCIMSPRNPSDTTCMVFRRIFIVAYSNGSTSPSISYIFGATLIGFLAACPSIFTMFGPLMSIMSD